jgi:hypothetical protein
LSKERGWRFQNNGAPLSIDTCKVAHYRQSRRVDAQGKMVDNDPGSIVNDCKVALVAALANGRGSTLTQ